MSLKMAIFYTFALELRKQLHNSELLILSTKYPSIFGKKKTNNRIKLVTSQTLFITK